MTTTKYIIVLLVLLGIFLIPDLLLSDNIALEWHIISQLKIPIVLTAVGVGASISVASAALQTNLNNPLADPGIVGISSGASLMAALFIVFVSSLGIMPNEMLYTYSVYTLPLLCFFGAMISGAIIYYIARKIGNVVSSFILAGIAISTAFSAIVGWIYIVAPAQALQSLTFWLMGSLQYTNYTSLALVIPIMLVGITVLLTQASQLNLLYLGEQNAAASGADVKKLQRRSFICVALLVGISVSIAGSIAFLGLLVPHSVRKLHGYDNRLVFRYACLMGAIVMLLCVLVNEYMFTSAVPLSMLTASIGAPVFIYIVYQKSKSA